MENLKTIQTEKETKLNKFKKDLIEGVTYSLDLRNTWIEFNSLSKVFKNLFIFLLVSLTGYFLFAGDFTFWGILSYVGLLLSSLNLVLVDNMKLTSFLWGTLASVTSIIGAYHYGMYGDFTYYLYVFPWQAIGLVEWVRLRRESGTGDSISKTLTAKGWLNYTLIFIVSYVVMLGISTMIGGAFPYIDSLILSFGIVGQTLMSKSYKEQWYVWILQNITAITAWSFRLTMAIQLGESTTFPISMLIMWVIMLINAVFGAIKWTKESKMSNNKE